MFGIFFFSKYYTYNVHVEKQKENSLFPENFITLMIVSENQMLSPQMSVTINCADFRFSRFIICSCTISILFIIAVGRSPRSEDFFLLSGYERGKKWCEPKQLKVLSYELDSGLETNVSRPKKGLSFSIVDEMRTVKFTMETGRLPFHQFISHHDDFYHFITNRFSPHKPTAKRVIDCCIFKCSSCQHGVFFQVRIERLYPNEKCIRYNLIKLLFGVVCTTWSNWIYN